MRATALREDNAMPFVIACAIVFRVHRMRLHGIKEACIDALARALAALATLTASPSGSATFITE
jgi:hypothetical protein